MSSHRKQQEGFTLIELVVVLVILGILAAFAIPRFVNIANEARQAAVRGLGGAMRSAAALAHGLALARGATTSVNMEGQAVAIVNGYPEADTDGIHVALVNTQGFQAPVAGAGPPRSLRYIPTNAPSDPNNCSVDYFEAVAGGAASVTVNDSDCN